MDQELKQGYSEPRPADAQRAPKSYDDELENHEHVSSEVERTAQMLRRIEESLGALQKRLSPILVDDTSAAPSEGVPEPVRCSLANRIASLGDQAYELVRRVDELRASIDL